MSDIEKRVAELEQKIRLLELHQRPVDATEERRLSAPKEPEWDGATLFRIAEAIKNMDALR